MKIFLLFTLLSIAGTAALCHAAAQEAKQETKVAAVNPGWQKLTAMPQALSGRFAGVSNGALLLAGGSYFPTSLFEGGTKTFSDRIDVLDKPGGTWRGGFTLPRAVAQGAAVSDDAGLVCLGGGDLTKAYADVYRLRWTGTRIEKDTLPDMPSPAVFLGAARVNNQLYAIAGANSPTAMTALATCWRLDLSQKSPQWETLPPLPGPGRIGPSVIAADGAVYVLGGASLRSGADGKPARTYLKDAYRYRPGTGWEKLADMPFPLVAAPVIAQGGKRLEVFGGDDGENAARVFELKDAHPGFRKGILFYDIAANRWREHRNALPLGLVTTPAVRWRNAVILPGGEDRPGHRNATILARPNLVNDLRDDTRSMNTPQPVQTPVFVKNQNGYNTFRIPALIVSKRGTLLAFCEGRKNGRGDAGTIDMLLRRSTDNGDTWGPIQTVWSDRNTCGNPCPVVDDATGDIYLLMTHNLATDHEKDIDAGTSQGTRTVWITRSTDDGATWDKPREITSETKRPDWRWYATGPGIGIQLKQGPHKGRFVIPCDHSSGPGGYNSHSIYSDDKGKTWKISNIIPGMNECQVAELPDGTLMMNLRGSRKENTGRGVCLSRDGGATWTDLRRDAALIEPVCQGSILTAKENGKPVLLFCNPADTTDRQNLTIRVSRDNGKTWPVAATLHPGPAAYSSLCLLPNGQIACFYEGGEANPYENIILARFNWDWLTPK